MAINNKTGQLIKTFLRDISQKNKVDIALETYLKDIKPDDFLKKEDEIPFSSDRKYSACIYKDQTLVLGAAEMLLEKSSKVFKDIEKLANQSYRVVVFGKINSKLSKTADIKKKFNILAIITMEDPIRQETTDTLKKLLKENIQYRIISGDSPDTVTAIAKKINQDYPTNTISGEELTQLKGDLFEKAVLGHNIFARIKPQQKQLIVKVLKEHKLFTIMIGDGVNDVLALKESDLGIAMNGGSSMAKDVADVVLLNNSFSTLPLLLYEGRRIITNIQTIANIYLMKNVSSIAAILMLGFIGLRFPFDPKHVELASFLIIGIPSFVLAFEKHKFSTSDEGFIKRLLLFSAIVGFGNSIIYTIIYTYYDITSPILFYSRSILLTAVIFLGINNLFLIYLQHYTLPEILNRKIFVGLVISMFALFIMCLTIPPLRDIFSITSIDLVDLIISFCFCTVGTMIIWQVLRRLNMVGPSTRLASSGQASSG